MNIKINWYMNQSVYKVKHYYIYICVLKYLVINKKNYIE